MHRGRPAHFAKAHRLEDGVPGGARRSGVPPRARFDECLRNPAFATLLVPMVEPRYHFGGGSLDLGGVVAFHRRAGNRAPRRRRDRRSRPAWAHGGCSARWRFSCSTMARERSFTNARSPCSIREFTPALRPAASPRSPMRSIRFDGKDWLRPIYLTRYSISTSAASSIQRRVWSSIRPGTARRFERPKARNPSRTFCVFPVSLVDRDSGL